jgi:hypothetical protein
MRIRIERSLRRLPISANPLPEETEQLTRARAPLVDRFARITTALAVVVVAVMSSRHAYELVRSRYPYISGCFPARLRPFRDAVVVTRLS